MKFEDLLKDIENVPETEFQRRLELAGECGISAVDMVGETFQALGGGIDVNGIEVPPPTAGVLPLLEIIESPLLKAGDAVFATIDVARALYILCRREQSLELLLPQLSAMELLEQAIELVENSDVNFETYLAACLNFAGRREAFDKAALELLDSFGWVNPNELWRKLRSLLSYAGGGFAMIPSVAGNGSQDKKKVMTASGSGASS